MKIRPFIRIGVTLKVLLIATTAIILFIFTTRHAAVRPVRHEASLGSHLVAYDKGIFEKGEPYSKIDGSLLDVIHNTNVLLSKLEREVNRELTFGDDYSQTVLNTLENIRTQTFQLGLHYRARALKNLSSTSIFNNHNFSYIHNPVDACGGIHVILALPSAVNNFERRREIRNGSKGAYVKNTYNSAKMLFFLGKSFTKENNVTIQEQIDAEVAEFGDIVQEDFEDVYSNNRLKSVSILRWVSTYCSTAKFVIRSDDDITINVSALMPVLNRTADKLNDFILGNTFVDDPPARDTNSKYYMSLEEYPLPVLPPYIRGGLLGFPVSTAKILYEIALKMTPIWLEDVFITGICAAKVHIPILTDPAFKFKHVSS